MFTGNDIDFRAQLRGYRIRQAHSMKSLVSHISKNFIPYNDSLLQLSNR